MKFLKPFSSPYFIYRLGLWATIIGAIFFSIAVFVFDDVTIELPVKPKTLNHSFQHTLIVGNNFEVETMGNLIIKKPSIVQLMSLPNLSYGFDLSNGLLVALVGIQLLKLLSKIEGKRLFSVDISNQLKWIAIFLFSVYLFDRIKWGFAYKAVTIITENAFTINKSSGVLVLELWISILLLWLSVAFKRGYKLQQEQDLTV
jgi:Protein of unknown function (DUF2975)